MNLVWWHSIGVRQHPAHPWFTPLSYETHLRSVLFLTMIARLYEGEYPTTLPGFMTFGVIYTCLRYDSLLFMGMLASLFDIYNTTTVTTAGM